MQQNHDRTLQKIVPQILTCTIFFIVLTGCSSTNTHISQQTLLNAINNQTAPVIIDVRSTSEYQSGHVQGALHIPFYQVLSSDQLAPYNKEQCFVLYCEHGPRAGLAKLSLKMLGYRCIQYLEGHMKAWKAANLPMEK